MGKGERVHLSNYSFVNGLLDKFVYNTAREKKEKEWANQSSEDMTKLYEQSYRLHGS